MKSLNDNNNNGSSSDNNNNCNGWLGFSLSPHMKMEVNSETPHHHHHHNHFNHHHHHHTQSPSSTVAVPTSFYQLTTTPHHLNTSSICYGVGENGGFHSALSVMPLKSDGSLCIMEALSRSQSQAMVSSGSPKLEDFLGGTTMATSHYGIHEREAMALSLDSIYYTQNAHHHEPEEVSRHLSLDLLQEPFRHHHEEQQHHHHHAYYSTLQCYQEGPLDGGEHSKETHEELPLPGEELPCLKNWVDGHFSDPHHALDNPMNGNMVYEAGSSVASGAAAAALGCGDLQSLSLSMSPGSQTSCITAPRQISSPGGGGSGGGGGGGGGGECVAMETKKRGSAKIVQKQTVHRKSIDTFGQRTSQYRGVTRHRWTGRYEAHLWDNSCKKEGQTRKGRQVYLGGYDMEEKAARAYDLAALKYWGSSTHINFPLENYQKELEEMKNMTRQEYVAHLRRKSSGFSRGASMYRGVTRHHQHGRWQARIGRVAGNKDLYLGTFSTQEEAAEAYDIAAIKFRGANAVTNFDISRYDVEKIMDSNTLPSGELARRNKERDQPTNVVEAAAVEYNHNVAAAAAAQTSMVLYNHHQQQMESSYNEKAMSIGNYRNSAPSSSFPVSLQNLVGYESMNNASLDKAAGGVNNNKQGGGAGGGGQFSNPSSLVTSLSSSREGSPDKNGAKPELETKYMNNHHHHHPPSSTSWISSAQLRPVPLTMAHLPVFEAWGDA